MVHDVLKQDQRALASVVVGAIGIVALLLSYFCSGIFYEMLGGYVERLPLVDRLLSIGLAMPFPLGVAGLVLALVSDTEAKLKKTGFAMNVVLLILTVLIPLFFILLILSMWGVIVTCG